MSEPKNEIVVYQPDDTMRLDVRLQDETVWLSQEQMVKIAGFVISWNTIRRYLSSLKPKVS